MESLISSSVLNTSHGDHIHFVFFNPTLLHTFSPTAEDEAQLIPVNDAVSFRLKLEALRKKHRLLEAEIQNLSQAALPNLLAIQRVKKEKLLNKDEQQKLASLMVPDIIA